MISILKWLHRNEFLVHVAVGILVFYGLPVLFSAMFYPQALNMLLSTAIGTVIIVALGACSTGVAFFVTSFIKDAVTMASLHELARPLHEIAADKTIDLSSESVLVVKAPVKKPRKSKQPVENAVVESAPAATAAPESPAAETTVVLESTAVVAKKRPSRSKKSTQEA